MDFNIKAKGLLLSIFLICSFGCFQQSADAQVILYVELMSELKPIKYYAGQELMYKSKEYPEEWQSIKIDRIMDEEQIILYDGGMIKLDDIIELRRRRGWATVVGYMLQTFGVSWFAFGGLAHFTTSTFDFGVDTLVIGTTAIASGWLIRKLFKYKNYKVGRRVRLKILDVSWPEPTGG